MLELTMAVYADAPECGRKNVTDVRSGMFMMVNLSSAVIKENPTSTHVSCGRFSWEGRRPTLVRGMCARKFELDPSVGCKFERCVGDLVPSRG